ncbi:hypothetical protein M406DRAFT_323797 [Cryphonectria parasitica EP155]|uniref:Uncharacterized protein n=1 Tax=Cryphonectria parasitica (strain ATCC 38755 / EP155) TaxID=660469 RepID=A0A9P4XUX9_CRYP1|nr:uncharacterized protein M406DRAFT_323797 [Cryphonectria parasitica EP155]KAF3761292.1 hypothetical protein M406DRAFT_323797 [Cryphonectria parasitica EP155]
MGASDVPRRLRLLLLWKLQDQMFSSSLMLWLEGSPPLPGSIEIGAKSLGELESYGGAR